MAKKPKDTKLDDVALLSPEDIKPGASKSNAEFKSRSEGGTSRKKTEGVLKYQRAADDLVPPFEELTSQFPKVYSSTHILRHLTQEDVGKFICIEGDVKHIPHSLRTTLEDPFLMAGSYLLLRQPMFDLLQAATEIATDAPVNAKGSAIGVHGQRGGGKTALLNMLAVFALQNFQDWLFLGTRGEEFMVDLHGGIKPSTRKPGVFNQGRNSREYLRNLMATEGDKLKSVKLKRQYDYPWINVALINSGATIVGEQAREGAVAPTDLYGLCEQAVYDVELAADIFYDFIQEIKLATEIKTMVLIDNLNVWDQMSEFRDPANPYKKIAARNLSMINAFQTFQSSGPVNGLSVFAMTSHATLNFGRKHLQEATYAVEQKVYTNDELKTAYIHYKASRMLKSDLSPFLMARVKCLTGGVPRDAFFDAALI